MTNNVSIPIGGKSSKKWVVIAVTVVAALLLLCCIILVIVLVVLGFRGIGPVAALAPDEGTPLPVTTRVVGSSDNPVMTSTPAFTPTVTPTPTLGVGSTSTRQLDHMTMIYVPETEFTMGSDDGFENEKPAHQVALDDYWIDQTEVTNAMFQQFVDSTGYETDAEKIGQSLVYQAGDYTASADKWQMTGGADWLHPHGSSTTIDGLEDHPVVQVSWNDAVAYCEWAGGRLPTEAEWELAARGTDERMYPWGNSYPSGTLLNFGDLNLDAIWSDKSIDDGYKFTAPVGNYPAGASPFGALDMAGNIAEWVQDVYGYDYYANSPYSNPTGPASGGLHVLRGGQWSYTADGVRTTARISAVSTYSIDYSGFRCVYTP